MKYCRRRHHSLAISISPTHLPIPSIYSHPIHEPFTDNLSRTIVCRTAIISWRIKLRCCLSLCRCCSPKCLNAALVCTGLKHTVVITVDNATIKTTQLTFGLTSAQAPALSSSSPRIPKVSHLCYRTLIFLGPYEGPSAKGHRGNQATLEAFNVTMLYCHGPQKAPPLGTVP